MAQTPAQIQAQTKRKIELPEDISAKLYVTSMAALSVMYNLFTGTIYELEVKNQEINSLTRVPRDMQTGFVRGLAALIRARGSMQDIPDERIWKRSYNWFLAFVTLFAVITVISYGQYNTIFRDQILAFWNANSEVLVVGGLIFMAMVAYLWLRRRRSGKVAK